MKKLLSLFLTSALFLSACATTSVNLGDDREYYSEDSEACEKVEFACTEGTKIFSDLTGCGCEDIDTEESNIVIVEESDEESDEESAEEVAEEVAEEAVEEETDEPVEEVAEEVVEEVVDEEVDEEVTEEPVEEDVLEEDVAEESEDTQE